MPAFSCSQRRKVASDQTLPTPACFSTDALHVVDRGQRLRRVQRRRPCGNSISTSTGLAPVQLGIDEIGRRATACSRSGSWSAKRYCAGQIARRRSPAPPPACWRSGCRAPDGSPSCWRSSRKSCAAQFTARSTVAVSWTRPRLVAHQQHAELRRQHEHRDECNHGGDQAGLAEGADQFRLREQQRNERQGRGRMGEHAGRARPPASRWRNASHLSSPAAAGRAAAKVSCIESEKLITMISGVITLRNMLRRKSIQPKAPSDQHDARSAAARRRRS